jgi:tetratricopeptide (TPR) repeat protein
MKLRTSLACVLLAVIGAASCARNPEAAKRDHMARGDRYFQQEKYNEAIIEYRSAVQIDPRFGDARYKLGQAYLLV